MDKKELDILLRKVKQGDEKAFAEFYTSTNKGVFSFIYTYVNDYQMTQDLLLETYMKVREKIQLYQDGTNPTSWLFQIAKNESLNYIKSQKKTEYVDFSEHENMAGSYEDNSDTKEVLEIINNTLSKEDSRIVLLHLVDGYKHKEIAKILNMPLGTVLWKYNKSIKVLQEALGDYR